MERDDNETQFPGKRGLSSNEYSKILDQIVLENDSFQPVAVVATTEREISGWKKTERYSWKYLKKNNLNKNSLSAQFLIK